MFDKLPTPAHQVRQLLELRLRSPGIFLSEHAADAGQDLGIPRVRFGFITAGPGDGPHLARLDQSTGI